MRLLPLILCCLLTASSAIGGQPSPALLLAFPAIALAPDEQIDGFKVDVACGHVDAIRNIPEDWNVAVTRAISAVETVDASAGHGASYVRSLDRFSGMIRILPGESRCFSVSATVNVVYDHERVVQIPYSSLVLVQDEASRP